jgi:hypothetical protein
MGMRILGLLAILLPGFFSFDMLAYFSAIFVVMYAAYMVGETRGAVALFDRSVRVYKTSAPASPVLGQHDPEFFDDTTKTQSAYTDPRFVGLPGNIYTPGSSMSHHSSHSMFD